MNTPLVYKETQIFHILIIFMMAFLAGFVALLNFGTGTYVSFNSLLGVIVLFVGIIALFFNFTIKIDEAFLTLSFGIGLIKVKYPLKNITAQTITQEKIPGWIGLGIRLAPGGRLVYNTKPGKAVCFNTFTGKLRVCIVSNTPDALENILKERSAL
ncbi:hypothetical protein [Neptunitalea lumnitzerae]|uniref:PH domain-containing protein n=1 Tax=Neptunitalea lumnitzerae TaxID=2965509 RepID=A0ABQ5MFF3_9FLAO|nr:hypothetical protein [Neptunitalea sp. Y10]GLB48108.1 hypothetical protein Y10_04760 [Neptunitalea sp. Y10]